MTILLFGPPSADRSVIADAVRLAGHDVSLADTGAHASSALGRSRIDLTIVDLAGGSDARRFVRRQRSPRRGRTSMICVADRRQPDASAEALRLGVADIIARPVREDDVLAAIANASEVTRVAARRPEAPPEPLRVDDAVFGTSAAMRDVEAMVRRVAPSRCTVLIVGERGTGREMVARAIHRHGRRPDRPFLKMLCPDMRAVELEQLLDGGVPPGSTVYLEDIGELSAEFQPRLCARVRTPRVEEHPDDEPSRFIAASQPRITDWMERDITLRALIEALSVVRIDLAPLRQRSEDIPPLAMHFLKEACRRADMPLKSFSRSALTLLAAMPWPGNAGELQSLCERLVVLVPRGVVLLEDVLANVRLDGAEAMGRPRESLRQARERFERDYVTSVLQHHHGRMGEAANELGIERTNLYRKIKQLNIRWTIAE